MTTTIKENYYIAKYVQFNLEDQTKVVLHAEDEYYSNKNIARFNFLTMEGWYYTLEGKQIEVKRFSTIMNYFFKLDEYFGWDDKLVAQAKSNAKRIKSEESKLYQSELKEKSEQKATHFMNDFLTGEQATKLQAMEIEELKVLIKNTFKYASNKTLKTVLDAILNFDILELNTHETIEDTVQVETTNQTNNDASYTVGNRSFNSYDLALDYCNSNDFDADTMIIKEVATKRPYNVKNGTVYNFNYNSNEPSQYDWNNDVSKHTTMYVTLKDREYITIDQIERLINSNYAFTIRVVNSDPYKKSNYVMIDLTFNYGHKPITLYLKKDAISVII